MLLILYLINCCIIFQPCLQLTNIFLEILDPVFFIIIINIKSISKSILTAWIGFTHALFLLPIDPSSTSLLKTNFMVMVLLSASVKQFSVCRMQGLFYSHLKNDNCGDRYEKIFYLLKNIFWICKTCMRKTCLNIFPPPAKFIIKIFWISRCVKN